MQLNAELTRDQQDFAADNHNLIYGFLKDNHLPVDDFYDVVIFGYLRAVRKYFDRAELRKYAFSTIAWRAMQCEVGSYYRKQGRKCRHGFTVSLDAIGAEHPVFMDVLIHEDRIIEAMEATAVWDRVSESLSREQADVLQLAADGYAIREIASLWARPLRHVEALIAEAQLYARAVCAM